MTLKEIETKLMKEGKTGYAVICLNKSIANRNVRIGYFEDVAKYHGLSYENSQVEFIKYVGWEI